MANTISVDSPYKIDVEREKIIIEKADWVTSPGDAVIEFRDDIDKNRARPVVLVPIELLRFRAKNKRLISDTMSYKKRGDGVDLESGDIDKVQAILENMLYQKDSPAAKKLENAIKKNGQRREAVITCDGLLIDGNRRLMVLKRLYEQTHDPEYKYMKVVILPGHPKYNDSSNGHKIRSDSGGLPSNKEILLIEKARQFEEKGESKYTILDKAISIKEDLLLFNNIKEDYIQSEQPNLTKAALKKECETLEDKYLGPLRQAEAFLKWKKIDGQPDQIKNWNACRDIHLKMWKLYSPRERAIANGYNPDDTVVLQEILFNVIETGKVETDEGRKLTGDMKDIVRRIVHDFNNDPGERKRLKAILDIDMSKNDSGTVNSGQIKDIKPKVKNNPEDKPPIKTDLKDKPIINKDPRDNLGKKKAITKILLGGQDKEKINKSRTSAIDNLIAAYKKISKDNISIEVVNNPQELDDIVETCDKIISRTEELRNDSMKRKSYTLKKTNKLAEKYPSKKNKQ